MVRGRWRRLLPDRSQLWVLVVVLIVIFAGVSFSNLATAKSRALGEERAAQAQVDQLKDQNRRLMEAQTAAERGDDTETKARQFFGLGLPGETKVVAEPAGLTASGPASGARATEEPIWIRWWKQFVGP